MNEKPQWSRLAQAWSKHFETSGNSDVVTSALRRTLPLLQDPTAVPFVCRYRQETIAPLSNAAVRQLAEYWRTYQSLESLRNRILQALPGSDTAMRDRVEASISKSELEELYFPYKPAAKGSLEDRIGRDHPMLVRKVDQFWEQGKVRLEHDDENTVILLANRIASHLDVMDSLNEHAEARCSIKVSASKTGKKTKKDDDKFRAYHDFECNVKWLRDHQVLAIRRGVEQKALSMQFVLDSDRAESAIYRVLRDRIQSHGKLWKASIHNSYTRLLRKRSTSRLWKHACSKAEQRAIHVFCDNLRSALLAPPLRPSAAVLCLDPGFKAGIKVAMVDAGGELLANPDSTCTVHFVDNWEKGRDQLMSILRVFDDTVSERWVIALGNGHGTQEARKLVTEALQKLGMERVPVQLVDEAGASVWSVTQAAADQYPSKPSSALAAISIARRLQNPLAELVKIPPRSLGLGMYQHDFSERDLEEKLEATSIDAVAEVGVDGNACSREILEKVPGLTTRLAERIIKARPLQTRQDILKVSGIGPSTFENCVAFIRVQGREKLDSTLCHPESYDLSRFLLRKLQWKLNDPASVVDVPPDDVERLAHWKPLIDTAAEKYSVPHGRVVSVMDQLIRSISNQDPRLVGGAAVAKDASNQASMGLKNCSPLPPHLSAIKNLERACPVRSIQGTVRNVVDFGVFIDFGGEADGLLHRSKLGTIELGSLLVGQPIGVDVINVDGKRISLAVPGLKEDKASKKRSIESPGTTVKQRKRRK